MLDFNGTEPARPFERFDLDSIIEALRRDAKAWVPQHFPKGRREGNAWRLANIHGAPPRKQGSCVIALEGPNAGDWIDFDGSGSGGPLSALEQATGLKGRELYAYAATLIGQAGSIERSRRKKQANGGAPTGIAESRAGNGSRNAAIDTEIRHILARSVPIRGTLAETYLRGRGLEPPDTDDLRFVADLTHFETQTGWPGMVGVVRDLRGDMIGLHRTYLALDGSAKAHLPTARMSLGHVGGGVVQLAAPTAGLIGLAEGIETALAVMTACPQLPMWAALSAGNLAELTLPPDIDRVVICADHDAGGVGLEAARKLATQLVDRGKRVWIAVPPGAGEDFNDLLAREEIDVVRAVIEAAEEFVVESPLLGAMIIDRDPKPTRSIDEVEKLFPLPNLEDVTIAYRRARDCRVLLFKSTGRDKLGNERWQAMATPFGAVARLRYLDHDEAFGLRVHLDAMDGRIRAVDFDRAALARLGASEIRAALFSAGLRSENDGDQLAVQILKAADPADEILVVSRPGWHRLDGSEHPVFVTPAGTAIGDDSAWRLELATNARFGTTARGSLDAWKAALTAVVSAKGCPHFLLGVLAGFAGVVQSLAGLDSCGINLSGLSSSGKTTAQRLAVSAWTSPLIGAGLLQSMRSTENAVEVFAQAASGTVLALDELAHADGRAIGRLIYAISGGQGKARLTAGAILKHRYAWSTYAVLSSECSLEEKVRADGAAWIAGMAVRILDVDVTDVDRTLSQSIIRDISAVEQHHGHAGPLFVEKLVAAKLHHKPDALRERVMDFARRLADERADAARLRAAICLALPYVAGQLAQDFGLLPWSIDLEAPVRWAWERFQKSSDAEALTPDEHAIASLRAWIAERWDVTIKSVDTGADGYDRKLNNREAVAWYDDAAIYMPVQRLREASGETLKAQQVVKALVDRRLLADRHSGKRAAVRWVPKIGRVDAYALKRSEFGRQSTWFGHETDGGSQ
jgi:Domain of unknown function (DUF927)/Toprim domain